MGLAMVSLDKPTEGVLYTGNSTGQPVTISLSDDHSHLIFHHQQTHQSWKFAIDKIKPAPPIQGLPRVATFLDKNQIEYRFECDDNASIWTLLAPKRKSNRQRHHGLTMRGWSALAIATVVFPLIFWFGYPRLTDGIALLLPDTMLDKLSVATLRVLDEQVFTPSTLDSSRKNQVTILYDELKQYDENSMRNTRLLFRHSQQLGANAMALPDGTMVILDDLVRIAQNDDEIAGVIAHEIGHIYHRHSIRQYVRATGLTFLTYFILGDSASVFDEFASVAVGITQLSYGRDFELEADRYSSRLMRLSGRDPNALIDMLEKLNASEKTGIFSTHPGLLERREHLHE